MDAADFARRGILPIAGGWRDQTGHCAEAIPLIWSLETPHRLKHELPE